MLAWLEKNLHIRASDEWGHDTLEADPLVHLLIGACASEAQLVHEAILESDERLQQRLLRYLLPEAFQYPQVAFGIAKAKATAPVCQLTPAQAFYMSTEKGRLAFTPAFDTTLVNGKLRFVCTDTRIIDYEDSAPSYMLEGKPEKVSKLLLGIESPQRMGTLDNISFYIDYVGAKGQSAQERALLATQKQALLLALSNSRWVCNEQVLKHRTGLATETMLWADQFDAEKELLRRVHAQYRLHFQVLGQNGEVPRVEAAPKDVLAAWLKGQVALSGETGGTTERWAGVKGHFTWLRVDLPYSVELTDPQRHLVLALNHFPVVNRHLVEKSGDDTFFTRSLGLELIPIQPEKGLFCGIQSVKNRETGEAIASVLFSQLLRQSDDAPRYSVRYGGVGRTDTMRLWDRFAYLLSVFRQEQREREWLDTLDGQLSLEELHEAIGQRTSKTDYQKAEQSTPSLAYLFVRPGSRRSLDTVVHYWVSDGEEANGVPTGTTLKPEKPLVGLDGQHIQLATPINGGKNRLSQTEQTQALQDTLVRRGRVVTANDVKSLCARTFGEHLEEVKLNPFFETDMAANGGVRRALEVAVKVPNPEDLFLQQLASELEWNLQENSVGTIPYRVRLC